MKTVHVLVVLLSASVLLTAGCYGGGSSDDGVKSSVSNAYSEANDAAVRVHGDWTKLTPAEQDKFKQQFGGVKTAKKMIKQMAAAPPKPPAPSKPK
jgi:hypothetical protein